MDVIYDWINTEIKRLIIVFNEEETK